MVMTACLSLIPELLLRFGDEIHPSALWAGRFGPFQFFCRVHRWSLAVVWICAVTLIPD